MSSDNLNDIYTSRRVKNASKLDVVGCGLFNLHTAQHPFYSTAPLPVAYQWQRCIDWGGGGVMQNVPKCLQSSKKVAYSSGTLVLVTKFERISTCNSFILFIMVAQSEIFVILQKTCYR